MEQKRKELSVDPGRCVGCMTCMLRCSHRLSGAYSPARAALAVRGPDPGTGHFTVTFKEQCDGCGICAAFCLYGGIFRAGNGGVNS